MEVLIFKTNLTHQSQASKLLSLLTSFPNINRASIDLDDCDKVLRIVGNNPSSLQIEQVVGSLGISCSELED